MKSVEDFFNECWDTTVWKGTYRPSRDEKKDMMKMFFAGFSACFFDMVSETIQMPVDMGTAEIRKRWAELDAMRQDMRMKRGLFKP